MMQGKLLKTITAVVLSSLIAELLFPLRAWALTGGPTQPEFRGFEPVTTTNMVNPLTGQFTYNLPLVEVPGPSGSSYAISLAYHSGLKPEDQASWVGWGWTLNPGAVIRQKRNIPDDFSNVEIVKEQKSIPNVTWSTRLPMSVKEAYDKEYNRETTTTSDDSGYEGIVSTWDSFESAISASLQQRHNNFRGWSLALNMGLGFTGASNSLSAGSNRNTNSSRSSSNQNISSSLSLGMVISDQPVSFYCSLSPTSIMEKFGSLVGYNKDKGWKVGEHTYFSLPCENPSAGLNISTQDKSFSFNQTRYKGYSISGDVTVLRTDQGNTGKAKQRMGNYSHVNYSPDDKVTAYGRGYMYPFSSEDNDKTVYDYIVEKEHPFVADEEPKRFLPIPYSGADYFVATGMGVQGQFRLLHNKIMSVRPPVSLGEIELYTMKPEVMLPEDESNIKAATGGGLNFGFGGGQYGLASETGTEYYKTGAREAVGFIQGEGCSYQYRGNVLSQFRFVNDKGGSFVSSNYGIDYALANLGKKPTARNYVGYRTVNDIRKQIPTTGGGTPTPNIIGVTTYGKNTTPPASYPGLTKSIGEFALFDDNGNRYVYGQPVYAMNEQSWQFGLYGKQTSDYSISNNYRVYSSKLYPPVTEEEKDAFQAYNGQILRQAYASEYLLTEVTTTDYVDVTRNGLSDDDLGGYTKFTYQRPDANKNSPTLYKWRLPYKGFASLPNKKSVNKDDYAAVSYGEKEIYYLKSVETKTHIAYFVTNKTDFSPKPGLHLVAFHPQARMDAFPALSDERQAGEQNSGIPNENQSEYLDHICIYVKDVLGHPAKLIKQVRFEYDYSLMPGDPSSNQAGSARGKLTLKKLWVEGDGVVNAKISPYEFQYSYPIAPTGLPSRYTAMYNEYQNLSAAEQNPSYACENSDRWGYYCMNGNSRKIANNDWNEQFPDKNSFDPAAWHLKAIKLPSGGEIHVQYEQQDYTTVQDRQAMIMAKLHERSTDDDFDRYNITTLGGTSDNIYVLDLGATLSDDELLALKETITEQFINKGEKIFFRFYYDIGSQGLSTTTKTEYISGYAKVRVCVIDEDPNNNNKKRIALKLGDAGGNAAWSKIAAYTTRPLSAAYDFKKAHNLEDDEDSDFSQGWAIGTAVASFASEVLGNESMRKTFDALQTVGTLPGIYQSMTSVPNLIKSGSYLRIPWNRAKIGGGVRVKRLLMYNPKGSLEVQSDANDQMIYGTEYLYQEYNSNTHTMQSSGVALNEPAAGREENALVCLINDGKGEYDDEIVAGDNIEHFEGPLGEELLPSAVVNYAQVITKSINNGPSSGGFSVIRYNTCKESRYKTVDVGFGSLVTYNHTFPPYFDFDLLGSSYSTRKHTADAGYTFTINNMHGTVHSIEKYAVPYDETAFSEPRVPISAEEYVYHPYGSAVRTFSDPDIPFRKQYLGKEVETLKESRRSSDESNSFEFQFSIGVDKQNPPIIYLGLFPYVRHSDETVETSTHSMVISHPVFIDTVKKSQDGITHLTENIAFNPSTGEPNVIRTSDGYDKKMLGEATLAHEGSYYVYTLPLEAKYQGAGSKATNADWEILQGQDPSLGQIEISVTNNGTPPSPAISFGYSTNLPTGIVATDPNGKLQQLDAMLQDGDMIELKTAAAPPNQEYIYYLQKNTSSTVPTGSCPCQITYSLKSIPGVSASLPTSPSQLSLSSIKIIKSGNSNQLMGTLGQITVYGGDAYVNDAIAYSDELFKREEYTDHLNARLFNGQIPLRFDLLGGELYGQNYSNYLSGDQHLSYRYQGSTQFSCSRSFDFIYENNIILGEGLSAYTISITKDCDLNQITISINNASDNSPAAMVYANTQGGNPPTPCVTHAVETLPYHGTEMFGVNDDGELVYYSFVNGQTNERKLSFCFRGSERVRREDGSIEDHLLYNNPGYRQRFNAFPQGLQSHVISANAATYSKDASIDYITEGINMPSSNNVAPFETTPRIWRPVEQYYYNSGRLQGSAEPVSGDRVYSNAGAYTLSFTPFNWSMPASSTATWVKANSIESYSPHGGAVQDVDALGIHSAVLSGYNGQLPACAAKNAQRNEIYFQSFEATGLPIPSGANSNGTTAHTGKRSLKVKENYCDQILKTTVSPSEQKNFIIRFWADRFVKEDKINEMIKYSQDATPVSFTSFAANQCRRISRVGEWTLYEIEVSLSPAAGALSLQFCAAPQNSIDDGKAHNSDKKGNHLMDIYRGRDAAYYDDIKIQPADASMSCYVYEGSSLRMLASFSDDHYASLYQYNPEGQPIRTLAETYRGWFTVSEKELNLKKQYRPVLASGTSGQGGGGIPLLRGINGIGNGIKSASSYDNQRNTGTSLTKPDNPLMGVGGDILDINITPDTRDLKIFGRNVDSLKLPTVNIDSTVSNTGTSLQRTANKNIQQGKKNIEEQKAKTQNSIEGVHKEVLDPKMNAAKESMKRLKTTIDSTSAIKEKLQPGSNNEKKKNKGSR